MVVVSQIAVCVVLLFLIGLGVKHTCGFVGQPNFESRTCWRLMAAKDQVMGYCEYTVEIVARE